MKHRKKEIRVLMSVNDKLGNSIKEQSVYYKEISDLRQQNKKFKFALETEIQRLSTEKRELENSVKLRHELRYAKR